LEGCRLTIGEIFYCLLDHPVLIQSFVWQFNDLAPRYPKWHEVLDYWGGNTDVAIHSVAVIEPRANRSRERPDRCAKISCYINTRSMLKAARRGRGKYSTFFADLYGAHELITLDFAPTA
jgi:uncharacterized protein Usg